MKRKCDICLREVGPFRLMWPMTFEGEKKNVCGICKSYYHNQRSVQELRLYIDEKSPQNLAAEAKAEAMAERQRRIDAQPKIIAEYEDFIFSPEGISKKYLKKLDESYLNLELAGEYKGDESVAVVMTPDDDFDLDIILGYLYRGEMKDEVLKALHGEYRRCSVYPIEISGGEDPMKVLKVRVEIWN